MLRGTIYPLLVGGAMATGSALVGMGVGQTTMLAMVMLPFLALLTLAERALPFESAWNRSHGDVLTDSIHTAVTSVVLPRLYWPAYIAMTGGALSLLGDPEPRAWPVTWPLAVQVTLALVVTEFFWYWLHRLSHETELLWRLHSVHHSARRQYWLNGSRDHPAAVLMFAFVVVVPLVALGCPSDVLALYLLMNGAHGAFQHANVDARLGPLNWIVSMSELHRWHHSTVIAEANANYGHNLIVWDVVFGTRRAPGSSGPQRLGIADMPEFPASYWGQLTVPFRWAAARLQLGDAAKEKVANSTR